MRHDTGYHITGLLCLWVHTLVQWVGLRLMSFHPTPKGTVATCSDGIKSREGGKEVKKVPETKWMHDDSLIACSWTKISSRFNTKGYSDVGYAQSFHLVYDAVGAVQFQEQLAKNEAERLKRDEMQQRPDASFQQQMLQGLMLSDVCFITTQQNSHTHLNI